MPGPQAVKGRKEFAQKLRGLAGPDVVRAAGRVLFVGADMVKAEAQRSITAGSVSGKGHVPSAPGEAPNNDTGILKNNIETALPSPLVAEVTSNAPYAAALEFGTSKMAARPYMRPARDKVAPQMHRLFKREIDQLVKKANA